jgi:glutamate dehydrogenase (NAD(P)+)
VLIPAALGGVLTEANADHVQAKLVLEAAHGACVPAADESLHKRGVLVVPDLLASAGSVTVDYLEWVQNQQQFPWEEERVLAEQDRMMRDAWSRVLQLSRAKQVPLRTAAFILAIGRVGKATVLRGV